MSARAYVLVQTVAGKSREVSRAFKRIKGVRSVDVVTGPYDIIVTIEGESLDDVAQLIPDKIHPVAGILRMVTCVALWSTSKL